MALVMCGDGNSIVPSFVDHIWSRPVHEYFFTYTCRDISFVKFGSMLGAYGIRCCVGTLLISFRIRNGVRLPSIIFASVCQVCVITV